MTIMIRIKPAAPTLAAIGTIETASVMPGVTPWLGVGLLPFDEVCLEVIVVVVVVMNAEKRMEIGQLRDATDLNKEGSDKYVQIFGNRKNVVSNITLLVTLEF